MDSGSDRFSSGEKEDSLLAYGGDLDRSLNFLDVHNEGKRAKAPKERQAAPAGTGHTSENHDRKSAHAPVHSDKVSPVITNACENFCPAPMTAMAQAANQKINEVSMQDLLIGAARHDLKDNMQIAREKLPDPALPEAYEYALKQFDNVADTIVDKKTAAELGPLLKLYSLASRELTLRNPSNTAVRDIFDYGKEVFRTFNRNLEAAGADPSAHLGKLIPPLAVELPDAGAPYIVPPFPGQLDLAVTAINSQHRDLLSVFGPAYAHEIYGHGEFYGQLFRFDAASRDKLLTEAVNSSFASPEDGDKPVVLSNGELFKDRDQNVVDWRTFKVDMLKAQDNESTSDMVGTCIAGPALPESLGILLQAERKNGKLSLHSAIGPNYVERGDDGNLGNPLGIEVHGHDVWRVKLMAETMRQLAAGTSQSKDIVKFANALDSYANAESEPGDSYRWEIKEAAPGGKMEGTGVFVNLPRKEWDAIIPELVKKQLQTPLDQLNGKTLKDISQSNFLSMFARESDLAGKISDAMLKGDKTINNFSQYDKEFARKYGHEISMLDVVNAGPLAWEMATQKGLSAQTGLERPNTIHETLRAPFRDRTDDTIPVPDPDEVQPLKDKAAAAKLAKSFVDYLHKNPDIAEHINDSPTLNSGYNFNDVNPTPRRPSGAGAVQKEGHMTIDTSKTTRPQAESPLSGSYKDKIRRNPYLINPGFNPFK